MDYPRIPSFKAWLLGSFSLVLLLILACGAAEESPCRSAHPGRYLPVGIGSGGPVCGKGARSGGAAGTGGGSRILLIRN